jgi:MFS family permease
MSLKQDEIGGSELHFKTMGKAAIFLVMFAVFSSTLSWDWLMSIDTHWFSTLYGWYVFSGMWVTAMIVALVITIWLRNKGLLPQLTDSHIHDVAKWMFAISFLWSYLWFSQFMLIWYSNIPEEVIYFRTRIAHYPMLFFGMFFTNLIFPMVILMSKDAKRNPIFFLPVALIIFMGHWFDVFCLVMPGTVGAHWHYGFMEIGMFLGFLGMFVFVVLSNLSKAPVMVKQHPFLDESVHHNY